MTPVTKWTRYITAVLYALNVLQLNRFSCGRFGLLGIIRFPLQPFEVILATETACASSACSCQYSTAVRAVGGLPRPPRVRSSSSPSSTGQANTKCAKTNREEPAVPPVMLPRGKRGICCCEVGTRALLYCYLLPVALHSGDVACSDYGQHTSGPRWSHLTT